MYCVYLTIYLGNKLPMFYIGSTTTSSISEGYRGSVQSLKYKKIWKNELLNSPNLFKIKIISYHKTRKEAYLKEEFFQRKLNVIKSPLYINLSYSNGGFIAEKNKKLPKEWRENISKAQIGRKHSLETRLKQSLNGGHRKGQKNKPEWNKKNSESNKKVLKTPEWNKKNSISLSGRIHIANVITKERKFIKINEAYKYLNEINSTWIKLGTKSIIPDFI